MAVVVTLSSGQAQLRRVAGCESHRAGRSRAVCRTALRPWALSVAMSDARTRSELPSWPLAVLFVGYPLWWATGFSWLAVIGAALLMLALLVQHDRLQVPPG